MSALIFERMKERSKEVAEKLLKDSLRQATSEGAPHTNGAAPISVCLSNIEAMGPEVGCDSRRERSEERRLLRLWWRGRGRRPGQKPTYKNVRRGGLCSRKHLKRRVHPK